MDGITYSVEEIANLIILHIDYSIDYGEDIGL